MSLAEILAATWRTVFVTAGAPAIGSVLLLAIARLVGADWRAAALPLLAMRLTVVGAALLGLAQAATVPPGHLATWMHPLAVGARAIAFAGAVAVAGTRLRNGVSRGEAGVVLAVYAWVVTPVASDWLLGQVPGHSVSAVGMILFVEQIAGACALTLMRGVAEARLRRDLGALMIAGMLGLGYLAYMDYLIVWYGNLPARVPFYLDRSGPAALPAVLGALLVGLAAPIGLLATGRARLAGGSVLVGLGLFNLWWVGGGLLSAAVAGAALALLLGFAARRAHD